MNMVMKTSFDVVFVNKCRNDERYIACFRKSARKKLVYQETIKNKSCAGVTESMEMRSKSHYENVTYNNGIN